MRDNGENLSDERDGFVTHGMRVSNVSFDDVFEWFLDASLELLDIQQFSSSEIITTQESKLLNTFSMAVALMTRGPLTAYSIFLMQGFMLSRVTVAGAAIFSDVDEKLRQVDKNFCLKLIIP